MPRIFILITALSSSALAMDPCDFSAFHKIKSDLPMVVDTGGHWSLRKLEERRRKSGDAGIFVGVKSPENDPSSPAIRGAFASDIHPFQPIKIIEDVSKLYWGAQWNRQVLKTRSRLFANYNFGKNAAGAREMTPLTTQAVLAMEDMGRNLSFVEDHVSLGLKLLRNDLELETSRERHPGNLVMANRFVAVSQNPPFKVTLANQALPSSRQGVKALLEDPSGLVLETVLENDRALELWQQIKGFGPKSAVGQSAIKSLLEKDLAGNLQTSLVLNQHQQSLTEEAHERLAAINKIYSAMVSQKETPHAKKEELWKAYQALAETHDDLETLESGARLRPGEVGPQKALRPLPETLKESPDYRDETQRLKSYAALPAPAHFVGRPEAQSGSLQGYRSADVDPYAPGAELLKGCLRFTNKKFGRKEFRENPDYPPTELAMSAGSKIPAAQMELNAALEAKVFQDKAQEAAYVCDQTSASLKFLQDPKRSWQARTDEAQGQRRVVFTDPQTQSTLVVRNYPDRPNAVLVTFSQPGQAVIETELRLKDSVEVAERLLKPTVSLPQMKKGLNALVKGEIESRWQFNVGEADRKWVLARKLEAEATHLKNLYGSFHDHQDFLPIWQSYAHIDELLWDFERNDLRPAALDNPKRADLDTGRRKSPSSLQERKPAEKIDPSSSYPNDGKLQL